VTEPMQDAAHRSVLLDEVVESLDLSPGRLVVDGTFGAGGYSRAFLDAGADVIAIDRDPTAARFAVPLQVAHPDRFRLVQGRFSDLQHHLLVCGHVRCDGVALDLGVSSMQLDEAERGFSFMRDGPLDMRMGAEARSAADMINEDEPGDLARIFWIYARSAPRAASPPSSPADGWSGPSPAPSIWPKWWKRPWAGDAARRPTRLPACSRPCGSPSTKSWPSLRRASTPLSAP
jgi:hypothetical protein